MCPDDSSLPPFLRPDLFPPETEAESLALQVYLLTTEAAATRLRMAALARVLETMAAIVSPETIPAGPTDADHE